MITRRRASTESKKVHFRKSHHHLLLLRLSKAVPPFRRSLTLKRKRVTPVAMKATSHNPTLQTRVLLCKHKLLMQILE
jgi:hypothetical protein